MLQKNEKTFLKAQKGKKGLPDLRTAIFATLKGYYQGVYPSKLEGVAAELGYYPLSEATPSELEKIEEIVAEVAKQEGVNLDGKNS